MRSLLAELLVRGISLAHWLHLPIHKRIRRFVGAVLVRIARAHLDELDAASVLGRCIEHLNQSPIEGFEWFKRLPFVSLLMMKWSAELWYPGRAPRPLASPHMLGTIQQLLWDANGQLVRPGDGPVSVFFRRMSFQQFWYQRPFDSGSLARQAVLFAELLRNSPLAQDFFTEVGVGPAGFVRIMAKMIAQVGHALDKDGLRNLEPLPHPSDAHDWPLVTAFFQTDLRSFHETARAAAGYHTPPDVEVCEESQLLKTPFFQSPVGPALIHHTLLYRATETKLYDVLRARNPRHFMNAFGPAFQDYVGCVVGELPFPVIEETSLQQRLRGRGKCVDFAVVTDDLLLLIDAKGIEGHYDELYHSLPGILTDKLKTTVLHAIDQGVETLERLPGELKRRTTIFLCVTFKQMNIGNGTDLRDLTTGTAEWNAPRWSVPELPPTRMFTITIRELELLCAIARTGKSLTEIFDAIVANNAAPITKRRLIEMHLAAYGPMDIPTFSREAIHRLCGV